MPNVSALPDRRPARHDPERAPPPEAPRRFHHGDLRRALVDAALAAPDLEGLSLRQLAAEVGVTAAAVYRHFDGRDALLAELTRIGFDRLEQRFATAFDIGRPPVHAFEAGERLQRLGEAYLQFADDEPALWRLMFGMQAAGYRAAASPADRRHTYDYLPAALLGLHQTGVIAHPPDARDVLFAWSAVHGLATLRSGGIPAARAPVGELAVDVTDRIVRALGSPAHRTGERP
jgi:AcrR family transcriptional regulator